MLLILGVGAAGPAAACIFPERPFLPQSQEDMRTYADLIRGNFDAYIDDVQDCFRCLDEERARAFIDVRGVSEEYGRFLDAVE
jgi:hypothetical protein